jgi:hypothetical protein
MHARPRVPGGSRIPRRRSSRLLPRAARLSISRRPPRSGRQSDCTGGASGTGEGLAAPPLFADAAGEGAASSAGGVAPTPSGRATNVSRPAEESSVAPMPSAATAQIAVKIRIVVRARRRPRACCCFSDRAFTAIGSVDRLLDERSLALERELTDDRSESGGERGDECDCEHAAQDSVPVLSPRRAPPPT